MSEASEVMKALLVNLQVIHALVLRETRTRYGTNRLGYLWAFVDPLAMIGVFVGVFVVMGRGAPVGMDMMSFFATGFLPLMLYRSTSGRAVSAIGSNRGLLYYPQVRPLDLVIARSLLEVITLIVVFGIIMGVVAFLRQALVIDDLLTTLAGLGLAGGLGASFGLVVCGISAYWDTIEKVVGYVNRPMMWISGVFYTANELPTRAREFLLYNPLLHCTEILRDGWFRAYTARHASLVYPLVWIVVLLFLGLLFERAARRRLEFS